MKRKIVSFLLVATMLMTYSPFAFAESLDLEGSSEVVQENFEQNESLIENDSADLGEQDLDANKDQIFVDPVYDVADDTEIIENDLGVIEGSGEPSEITGGTTPPTEINGSEEVVEGDTEGLDDEFGVDDSFIVDGEEDIDSEFGVDSEDTGIGSMDIEDEGLSSDNVYIDPSQDDSGYIVIETPEDAYDGLDINGPTATEEDPEEEVDPGYTISEEEEKQGQVTPREPLIFKTYDGLTLYRDEGGAIAASDYICTNSTGVDVCLIGVEVVPINGWEMVGSEVDFKNLKTNTREFRLSVNGQVIQDYDGDGFIFMRNPEVFFDGEEICIPLDLEIGPFNYALNEGLFSFVLVFEEIIREEPTAPAVEEVNGVQGETQEVSAESEEETQEVNEEDKSGEEPETKDSVVDLEGTSDDEQAETVESINTDDGALEEKVEDIEEGPIEVQPTISEDVQSVQASAELAEIESMVEPYPFEDEVVQVEEAGLIEEPIIENEETCEPFVEEITDEDICEETETVEVSEE